MLNLNATSWEPRIHVITEETCTTVRKVGNRPSSVVNNPGLGNGVGSNGNNTSCTCDKIGSNGCSLDLNVDVHDVLASRRCLFHPESSASCLTSRNVHTS